MDIYKQCKDEQEFLHEILSGEEGEFIYRGQSYDKNDSRFSLKPSAWRKDLSDNKNKIWRIAKKEYGIDIPDFIDNHSNLTSDARYKEIKAKIAKQSLAEMILLNLFAKESNHIGLYVTSVEPFPGFGDENTVQRWAQYSTQDLEACHGYLTSNSRFPGEYEEQQLKVLGDIFLMLSLAQHHGVPTRLLDWSRNPLKASFFSTNITEKTMLAVARLDLSSCESLNISLIDRVPNYFNEHLYLQEGIFTYNYNADYSNTKYFVSLEDRIDQTYKDYTEKTVINSEGQEVQNQKVDRIKADKVAKALKIFLLPMQAKDKLRKRLHKLGVTENRLMPSYGKVCKSIMARLEL